MAKQIMEILSLHGSSIILIIVDYW